MRVMAFDYGTKRIGIAVTDPLQIIANALATVHPNEIWKFLDDYMKTEQVSTFVVGDPKRLDGTPSQSAPHVLGFVRKLKKIYPHIAVVNVDERFTSKLAAQSIQETVASKSRRRDKGLVDQVSATIILQSYLDTQMM